MRLSAPKKNHSPIPPEYANVRILKWIAFLVGFVCLSITSYATWTIYTLSNRIGMHEIPLEIVSISKRVTPINFGMLESVRAIDKEKKSFMLEPIGWDMFYQRTITPPPSPLSSMTSSTTSTISLQSASISNTSTEPLL
jgi:hypothetical protein